MNSTDYNFLFRYLKKAKVPFLKKDIEEAIAMHPHAPSLKAYADILTDQKVENMAVRIETEDLYEIDEYPVIVHMNIKQGEFALLESIDKESGVQYFLKDRVVVESIDEFEKKWSGAVLLLSAPKAPAKPSKIFWLKKYASTLMVALGITLLVLSIIGQFVNQNIENGIFYLLYALLSIVGLIYSERLLQTHLDRSTNSEKHCKKSKNVDCEAVIFSKWGQLFGLFNLAHIGIVFYAGTLLALISAAATNNNSLITLLALSNGLAGIFTVYSISLQAFVIKKWCTLCLICQGVTIASIIMLALFGYYNFQDWSVTLDASIILISTFMIPTIFLQLFLKEENSTKKLRREQSTLAKLRGDKTLFKFLQLREMKAPPIDQLPQLIRFGNPNAENQLIMVASLFCGPCFNKYIELRSITEKYPNEIGLTIIFTASDEFDHELSFANKIMISLAHLESSELVNETIQNWYKTLGSRQGKIDWIKENEDLVKQPKEELEGILMKHIDWLKSADIKHTPSVFYNNAGIPELFSNTKDLVRLLS